MRELLEAGVHFGHQTRRWNPKMRRFIFAERGGIYIIDLTQSLDRLEEAHHFVRNIAERNGIVLFVGTKKQAQDAVAEQAKRVGMPYVNHRWLGGLLTNWKTISSRIERLHELRRLKEEGQLELLPAKERISMEAELEKLDANLGGVADMRKQPDALFVVDLRKETLAIREARRLNVPVIGLVDTNCDPDDADLVIPGNDDAIRACTLVARVVADGIEAGKQGVAPQEFEQKQEEAQPEPAPAEAGAGAGAPAEPQPPAAVAEPEAAPAAEPEAPVAVAEPEPAVEPEPEPAPEIAQPGVEVDAPPEHEVVAPRETVEVEGQ
jgi:small subunit ribosomal protein S2